MSEVGRDAESVASGVSMKRRAFLLASAAIPLVQASAANAVGNAQFDSPQAKLAVLEQQLRQLQ